MIVNWDSIKYIVQIPLKWYKDISNKVYHAYGSDFIDVKQDGNSGGLQIGIDDGLFESKVKSILPEPETGTVKSVDEIEPDENGNVELGAIRSINGEIYPDENGDVELDLDGAVKSVDNVLPDDNGNVTLNALQATDITTIGQIVGLDYSGDYSVCSPNHGHKTADLNDWNEATKSFVKTVNTKSPDANGNVNVGTVRSVNNTAPDASGNVTIQVSGGKVNTVDNISPDGNGNVNLGAVTVSKVETAGQIVGLDYSSERYVCNVNHGHSTDDLSDWDDATSSFVKKVDGHSPNTSGEVSFGLSGSKWVKTDANGHLTTTSDKVPTVSSSDNLYSDSITVVTAVSWASNQIQITKKTLVFKNGLLTAINNATGNNIATVTYTGT